MNAVMREEFVFISREEAIAQGLKTFFTGVPCKHGHVAERLVCNRVCLPCNRKNSGRRGSRTRATRLPESIQGFTPDPQLWPDDGGKLRVPIYDYNFGQWRLVRRVGWTNCLGREPRHRIFSSDVARERICTACKVARAGANTSFDF